MLVLGVMAGVAHEQIQLNQVCYFLFFGICFASKASRKHLRTKVTPDFHLTYSENGGNLGSESK